MNDLSLTFRTSSCLGHLGCDNRDCDFHTRVDLTTLVNETKWEGISDRTFDVGSIPSSGSIVVCKVCKVPPPCLAPCSAKIYYVFGKDQMTMACVHLGSHIHPIKLGDYRDSIKQSRSLISKQVRQTPTATNLSFVLEASKELIDALLLAGQGEEHKTLELTDLLPLFDRCKQLTSSNVFNSVLSLRYLQRFGIMDNTTRLYGSSN